MIYTMYLEIFNFCVNYILDVCKDFKINIQ